MRRRVRRGRDVEDINISPLIDMTFLLLIFFMVSSTFVRDLELEIDRPGVEAAGEADPRSLRVAVDRDGNVFVESRPVQPWMIQSVVRQRLARTGVTTVLVVIDSGSRSGRLVEVVDQCRLAGAREVGVAVDREI